MSLLYGVKNKPEAQISVSKFMLRTSDDCEKKTIETITYIDIILVKF